MRWVGLIGHRLKEGRGLIKGRSQVKGLGAGLNPVGGAYVGGWGYVAWAWLIGGRGGGSGRRGRAYRLSGWGYAGWKQLIGQRGGGWAGLEVGRSIIQRVLPG